MTSRKKGMPTVHGNEVNVTPLIDVVMCLIIFYMLVAKIGVNQGAKPMDLAYATLGKTIDDMGNTLTLNVLPEGDMSRIKAADPSARILAEKAQVTALVDGVDKDLPITTEIGGVVRFPLREVLIAMKGRYKENLKVNIRADADLPYSLVQNVLSECATAGAKNLYLNVQNGVEPAATAAP